MELDFEHQLNALILFHLDEHVAGTHLFQVLQENSMARQRVGVPKGISKSTFFEAINTRGLGQLSYLFAEPYKSVTMDQDQAYQCHTNFELRQEPNKSFLCPIQEKTAKTIIKEEKEDSL